MNILEYNPTTHELRLYGLGKCVALHKNMELLAGGPARDTDGTYQGRAFIVLSEDECKTLLFEWMREPICLDTDNDIHRVGDEILIRLFDIAQGLAA